MKALFYSRSTHFLFLFILLLTAAHFSASDGFLRKKLQYLIFDYFNQVSPRDSTGKVLIADIDDESMRHLGQWPWPRTVLADIITNLTDAGAMVIAFDGVLAEPDRTSPVNFLKFSGDSLTPEVRSVLEGVPDHDQVLAEVIQQSGIFVSAFSFGANTEKPHLKGYSKMSKDIKDDLLKYTQPFFSSAKFLPALELASAGNGSFMAKPEVDGIIRRTNLFFHHDNDIYPALSLEALRVAAHKKIIYSVRKHARENPNFFTSLTDTDYELCLQTYKDGKAECLYTPVPMEGDAVFWIRYRSFDRKQDYISSYLLTGEPSEEIKQRIDGKIVLIASSAEGLKDLRSSPLNLFIPGVEVHANAIEQILQGDYLIRPKIIEHIELTFIIIAGLLMIVLAPYLQAFLMTGLCSAIIGTLFCLSWIAYSQHGILIDPVYASLTIFTLFVLSTLLAYSRTEADRRRVKNAFGHYISQDFMEELTKNPEKLALGGETRDLTVMFTDIRNFTSISERMSPAALIQLMNDFLTPMSDLVMQNRGTIDKFMGDAMMAFWNAPLDDPDHARHACMAALKMNQALLPINQKLQKEAEAQGLEPLVLQAGIGLNTGPTSVGNMGSRQRFAYSALGDTVNLASRLEGQTKGYGVNILIGPKTYEAVQDMAVLELDLLRVKGKQEPVKVYTLLGAADMAATDGFRVWRQAHDRMLQAYRQGDFTIAQEIIGECRRLSAGVLDKYYDVYGERIAELAKNPPDDGWDGVFVATSK